MLSEVDRYRSDRHGTKVSQIDLEDMHVNNIVWIVGAVVIIIAVLGFFGLR